MRVLLISTNNLSEPLPVLPIGIGFLSRALKGAGHQVRVHDLMWEKDLGGGIRTAVEDFKPELVGISVRNTDDYILDPPGLYLPMIRDTVEFLKESEMHPERIIAGGAAFCDLRESLLRYIGVRYGCIGDGEESIIKVTEQLSKQKSIKDIPGICYLDVDGTYKENPPDCPNIQLSKPPDWDAYDARYFTSPNKYGVKASISVLTKRGCKYNCIYCSISKLNRGQFRLREPRLVVDEIQAAKDRFPGERLELIDNDFNSPPQHAKAICEEIINRQLEIEWGCALHPTFITEPLLSLMKQAGCISVDIGIDSVSQRMLRNLNRPVFTKDTLYSLSNWCKELGIATTWACLIGGPGESIITLRETLETLEDLDPTAKEGWPAVLLYGGIRIYPETGIYKIAVGEGLLNDGHPALFPEYYMSPGLDEECYQLINSYKQRHPDWLFKGTCLDRGLKKYGLVGNLPSTPIDITSGEARHESTGSDLNHLPKISFPTLDDQSLPLRDSPDQRVVIVIAWMKNREDAKLWYRSLTDRLKHIESLRVKVIGAIPPLPNFVTRDFIKIQLKQAVQLDGPLLIDWDMQFVKGRLKLELCEKSVILAADASGEIVSKHETFFDEAELDRVVDEIQTHLQN